MSEIVLATDLGGTNLRMAAVNGRGRVVYRAKEKTPRSNNGSTILEAIVEMAAESRSECSEHTAVAIAAAVPGTIDFNKGVILKAPNLPELNGFPMVKTLIDRLGIEAILENDANAAAIGENWLGASRGTKNSLMVTLGTGVGGGIFVDGRILRGLDGTAGEIGHINVEPEGYPCGCGSHGCVEQYSSGSAIVRMAEELASKDPDSRLNSMSELSSEDVFEIAKHGDTSAIEVFRLQGYYLGIMLAGLVNTLNPEVIAIGGGASGSWDLFVPQMKDEIFRRSYKEPAERAKIVRAALGDDAGIMGGARLGFLYASKQVEAVENKL